MHVRIRVTLTMLIQWLLLLLLMMVFSTQELLYTRHFLRVIELIVSGATVVVVSATAACWLAIATI